MLAHGPCAHWYLLAPGTSSCGDQAGVSDRDNRPLAGKLAMSAPVMETTRL